MSTYEGWKNYATWNTSLWINNDYGLYTSARDFMQSYTGRKPYRDFIDNMGMQHDRTPDRIKWLGQALDYRALNSMMRELLS